MASAQFTIIPLATGNIVSFAGKTYVVIPGANGAPALMPMQNDPTMPHSEPTTARAPLQHRAPSQHRVPSQQHRAPLANTTPKKKPCGFHF